jgi:hypothetical protein
MLRAVHKDGFAAALQRHGIKEAALADTLSQWGGGAIRSLIGQPWRLGRGAFQPGGVLHWKNVFWPTVPGKPGATWLGRGLGTMLPAYSIYKATQGEAGDPSKGRLANTLGAAGSALGWAYGWPAVGLLGAPILGELGQSLGENVGNVFDRARRKGTTEELTGAPDLVSPHPGWTATAR